MKATEANLLKFLKKSPQFSIPIYQRTYSWTAEQCRQLWTDILRAGRDESITGHFIGSVVYVERGLSNVMHQEALLVIDGQQRLTTTTLLLAALARHFEQNELPELLDTFSARKIRNYYLVNPDEEGERHYKLLLSEADRETLLHILREEAKSAPAPTDASLRISENFALFKDLISKHSGEIAAVCKGLSKLVIVDVSLERSQDNPQLIFESMNSTGLELSQADLIRNFVLMGLESKLQTDLYKSYWRPMEQGFGQAAYSTHFDPFMRHYLTVKTGEIPNVQDVYTAFKAYSRNSKLDTRSLVSDIHAFARYYGAMALGKEADEKLGHAFHDLKELRVDVAYPFLLDAYHDYSQGTLTGDEFEHVVRMVESYVFRRAICAIPTNSMNKTFAGLSKGIKKDRYLESVKAAFHLLPSYRRFPGNDEFQREIQSRDLYNFRSRGYWLRRLENCGRKEPITLEDYSIEHILPQNEELSKEWRDELGPQWKSVQEAWLHTLGNLTLTGYNSEYSDRPFAFKRDRVLDKEKNPVGFASSPLRLNLWKFDVLGPDGIETYSLGNAPVWNDTFIRARAQRLSAEAVKVWASPALSAEVLDQYRPTVSSSGHSYTIKDHPHVASGPLSEVFELFRKEVLALDPCVSEEFLKLYIAYKAETNFVDIVPQAKGLRLTLNMQFPDLNDPRGLCRDVTGLGRWGNGDIEVRVTSAAEIPYVIGLVRQSLEQQMGGK